MADERTPLIAVVQTRPHRDRYPHHRLRAFCTVFLTLCLIFGITAAFLILNFSPFDADTQDSNHWVSEYLSLPSAPRKFNIPDSWPFSSGIEYEELVQILKSTPDREKAREWSSYYTAGPHLAGRNLSQALWTRERWEEWGVESTIVDYDVYLNYPAGHRLALLEQDKKTEEWSVKFEATLEEDVLEEDPTSGLPERIPTFHGYSANGNVTAQYVFVNYGTYADFEALRARNVSLEGKIALAKYGGVFRGLKVKRAQEMGMVGVVMYGDPGDDGLVTEKNGYEAYPVGPARNPSSVQRGSVQFLSFAPGDPTTPGYPSKPGCPRQPVDHAIPSIPSLPISYAEALPLLKALNGLGPEASYFGDSWTTGGLGYKGVEYSVGPSPADLKLNLVNEQEYVTTPLWNVIGIINGSIPDEVVVIGNHRDAWIAGGAGDPNSGSAAINEVIRSFGIALQAGWKPLRTIVFASWDGEEYGLVGSTEWVEEYLPWLSSSTVAYLNVDVATRSPHLEVSSAPLLNNAFIEAISLIPSPNQTIPGQSIADVWDKRIHTMGSGSDFTAFQDFAGIPSLDMGFGGMGPETPVYHYHSNYDSKAWMENFGDPTFAYHEALSKVWAVLAARLIETPVIQLNATEYAVNLDRYITALKKKSAGQTSSSSLLPADVTTAYKDIFTSLDTALSHFLTAAIVHDALASSLLNDLYHNFPPWWNLYKRLRLFLAVRRVNTKYKLLERQFLYPEGLDGRTWFKHVVFAPGKWTGYAGETFPGIGEGIERGDLEGMRKWAGIVVGVLEGATRWLGDD
ncbi:unnamed protein product [Periconia digitata]|uniref:Uncharacterized protein n=1 Tax=Periconia digitata TaxID=1303443 RepID=A0A9W4ULG9_9PLEO|nr:unnamed protein product [Periconia digitata]